QFWIRQLPTDDWTPDLAIPGILEHKTWLAPEFKELPRLPMTRRALVGAHDLMRLRLHALAIAPAGDRIATISTSDPRVRVRELPSGQRAAVLSVGVNS